jgi:serine/threonine protein kinase/tetratricopeptide (TPR) repeat protein
MGVVYEVLDRETNQRAALKTLRTKNAEMLLRFKDEFRGLQNVEHPNLVTLGELFQESGTWFFTMELVDGVNFIRYVRDNPHEHEPIAAISALDDSELFDAAPVRPGVAISNTAVDRLGPAARPGFHEGRLRSALAQLSQALLALHGANKVHRDIKPSNVMVTRQGRAVLLDFGFITDRTSRGHTTAGIVVGTADYMAPEQAAGKAVTTAADWYAVGVVLYRALTGRLPFTGSRMEVLIRKQQVDPPPPSEVLDGIPADLDTICMRLLSIDPTERATGEYVLAGLGVDPATTHVPRRVDPTDDQPFVGRQSELSRLHDAYTQVTRRLSVTVYLTGESGVGKTALLQRFAQSVVAGNSRSLVLPGRCHERESVPYKAVDGIVDVLSRILRHEPPEDAAAVLPLNISLLAQIFPTLRRVEAVAESPPSQLDVQDPLEQRRRVFGAMREMLQRIAERRPLVVIVEDLQWVDGDSMALLNEIMSPPDEPPMLLVASARTDAGASAAESLASVPRFSIDDGSADVRHIHLGGLAAGEARELAAILLREHDIDPMAGADSIAHEAGGHPLFIDELVQYTVAEGGAAIALPNLDHALWARISRLGETARKILEVLAVAGEPLRQDTIAEAAGIEFGAFSDQVARMRVSKLTRSTGTGRSAEIESYHGRVRDAVLQHLDPDDRAWCHHHLALALEAAEADPQALAIHWHGAGEHARAGGYAVEAADRALAALAFDRAARLYRQSLEWRPAEGAFGRRLQTRLGNALANAGRGAEAAQAYKDAAQGSSAAAQLELMRMAADQLLRSGHVDEGIDALRSVLAAAGTKLADSETHALWALTMGRARLRLRGMRFKERDATQVSLEQLTLIDIYWTVSIGLSNVDVIRGAEFQTRHLIEALDAGEPQRICRALAAEVMYTSAAGKGRRRTARMIAMARELADRLDEDSARGLVTLAEGVGASLQGEWARALAGCEAAELILRDFCTNVWWERNSAQLYAHTALAMLGRIGELAGRVPRRLREAEERGDVFAATNLKTGLPNLVWLAADDPDQARAQADEAMRLWSRRAFHVQHYFDLLAQTHIDLYTGDAVAARARVEEQWAAVEKSRLRRVQLIRVLTTDLRARAALAAGAPGDARRLARQIAGERLAWCTPLAGLIRAGASAPDAARRELSTAIQQLERADMALHAAAARRCLGQLTGGDEGASMIAESDDWMRAESIQEPARMAALVVPGFDTT